MFRPSSKKVDSRKGTSQNGYSILDKKTIFSGFCFLKKPPPFSLFVSEIQNTAACSTFSSKSFSDLSETANGSILFSIDLAKAKPSG